MKKNSELSFDEKLIIRKNKAKTVFIAKLAIICMVFCLVVLYFFAPISQVSNYELEGNYYLTSNDILRIANLKRKTSLYKINTKEVEETLNKFPLIESSKVTCNFFGLSVKIDEISVMAKYENNYYMSNRELVTSEMLASEVYGTYISENLDKTYRTDFNPSNLNNKSQYDHFNAIWKEATDTVRNRIAFFGLEQGYYDCVYLNSEDSTYYLRLKFFDQMDDEISTYTEIFTENKIKKYFDTLETQKSKFELQSFDDKSNELHKKDFYSIKIIYNNKQKEWSYWLDNNTTINLD